MSFALVMAILFAVLMVFALIFVGMPRVEGITWTAKREALMYRTAFWLCMAAIVCLVLSLVGLVKGY